MRNDLRPDIKQCEQDRVALLKEKEELQKAKLLAIGTSAVSNEIRAARAKWIADNPDVKVWPWRRFSRD